MKPLSRDEFTLIAKRLELQSCQEVLNHIERYGQSRNKIDIEEMKELEQKLLLEIFEIQVLLGVDI